MIKEPLDFRNEPMFSTFRVAGSIVFALVGILISLFLIKLGIWDLINYRSPTDVELRQRFEDCKSTGGTPIVGTHGTFTKCVYGPVKISD